MWVKKGISLRYTLRSATGFTKGNLSVKLKLKISVYSVNTVTFLKYRSLVPLAPSLMAPHPYRKAASKAIFHFTLAGRHAISRTFFSLTHLNETPNG